MPRLRFTTMHKSSSPPGSIELTHTYPCPICRHGEISTIALMDVFGCNFCQHLFEVSPNYDQLKTADSHLTLSWSWSGRAWRRAQAKDGALNPRLYWLLGGIFVFLPPSLVGLAAYLFPPMPGSNLAWLPWAWTGLTLLTHLGFLLWLMLEYYQFPLQLYLQALNRRWFTR
ncbi:MAG: hypothetical protein AAGG02_03725 [Cyanobacteria bacterium P01_H01_bin.15]